MFCLQWLRNLEPIHKNFDAMGIIKDKFKEKADATSAEIKELLKEHGDKVIGEVTLKMD